MEEIQPKKRRRGCGCGVALLILLVLLAGDYWWYPRTAVPRGPSANRGENGLWVRYKWYTGEETEPVERLAARLREGGITSAYLHVRYLKPDGTLQFRRPESAKKLTAALHELARQLLAQRIALRGAVLQLSEGRVQQ